MADKPRITTQWRVVALDIGYLVEESHRWVNEKGEEACAVQRCIGVRCLEELIEAFAELATVHSVRQGLGVVHPFPSLEAPIVDPTA